MSFLLLSSLVVFLGLLAVVGLGIVAAVAGWRSAPTTDPPGEKCERCSEGGLTLTRLPRLPGWVRALGYVLMAAPVGLGGPNLMENLRLARSESIDSGLAGVWVAIQVLYSVPFLILGGFLAFPFRNSVWRCSFCGHISHQLGATLILEQTRKQGTTGRTCIYCGKEILESAVACPHCWKEQKSTQRVARRGDAGHGFSIGFDLAVPLVLLVGSFLYWQHAPELRQQQQLEATIAYSQSIIEAEPSSARGQYRLGRALFQAGRLDESIASLTKAVELDPSDPSYKNILSFALAENGQFEIALEMIEQAITLQPDAGFLMDTKGSVLIAQG